MSELKKTLFTDSATATGGREGKVKSESGSFQLNIAMPIAEGYQKGTHTNPEELFAAAYAACFDGAIGAVAQGEGLEVTTSTTVDVSFGKTNDGFGIAALITAKIDGVDQAVAQDLLQKAHQICPYSKATRGNIKVDLRLA